MEILFVNPPATTCLNETKSGNQYIEENIGNQFFPLSKIPFEVMYKLNKIKGIEKDIVLLDFEWYKNPDFSNETLVEIVIKKEPDIILTNLISQASTDTLDWVTTKLKEKLPNLIIIVGGQAITYLQKKIFNFCPNIDFALIGNADKQLPKLIKKLLLQENEDFNDIEGLIYRKKNTIIQNSISKEELITYSEEIYKPYESLLKDIVKIVEDKEASVLGSEEFSKGCPYQCNFCAAKRKYEEKNIHKVISMLDYLCSISINKFYIEDLTFGVNSNYRKKVLEELKKLKNKHKEFGFRCVTRADLINKEFVKQLLDLGCYEVGIGIECNDGGIINLMNKKISVDENIKALEILGKSEISFKLFLIEGYPSSNTLTSKRTFDLLNYLEDKGYNYFIQPALNRDVIPLQKRFIEKENKGILRRGASNQLDFRHDCRKYSWDSNKSIRSICLLMLAYPSTELGKKNKDIGLQKRTMLDVPFLKENVKLNDVINFIKELPIRSNKKDILSLRVDLAHYIDGVYTLNEIKERLKKLYPYLDTEICNELSLCTNHLRKKGLIDSFGNSNLNKTEKFHSKHDAYNKFKRQEDIFLFWNGNNQRYIYAPLNKEVIKIKTCFYKNIPQEVFEFLIFCRGYLSLEEISSKLYKLFWGKEGFKNLGEARATTKNIYLTCKNYKLCF